MAATAVSGAVGRSSAAAPIAPAVGHMRARSMSYGPVLSAAVDASARRADITYQNYMRRYAMDEYFVEGIQIANGAIIGAAIGAGVGAAAGGVGCPVGALVGAGVGAIGAIIYRHYTQFDDYEAWAADNNETIRNELNEVVLAHSNHNSALICPLTKRYFRNPVMGSDGVVYERRAILAHLERTGKSPTTGAAMDESSLRPHVATFGLIRRIVREVAQDHMDRHTSLDPAVVRRINREVNANDSMARNMLDAEMTGVRAVLDRNNCSVDAAANEFQGFLVALAGRVHLMNPAPEGQV